MKKTINLILIILLSSCFVLYGCNADLSTTTTGSEIKNTSGTTTESTTESSTTTSEPAVKPLELISPLLPYSGEKITYTGFWDEYTEYKGDPEKTYRIEEQLNEIIGNIEIEWEPAGGDARTKLDLMMATGDLPDIIITVNMSERLYEYDMNYYLDLRAYSEYMPNMFALYEEYPGLQNLYGSNGEVYWIPQAVLHDMSSEMYWVNQNNLDSISGTAPTTLDEFIQVMRDYKGKYPERYPFLISYDWGISYYIDSLGKMLGIQSGIFYNENTKKWDFSLLNETDSHFKKSVELLALMYEEGLIYPDAFSFSKEQGYKYFRDGDWLFSYSYIDTPSKEIFSEGETIPFECVPMLTPGMATGNKGFVNLTYRSGMYRYDGGLINANVKNPELLCSYIDVMLSEEAQTMRAYGIEGETYYVDQQTGNFMFNEDYAATEAQNDFGMWNNMLELQAFHYKYWRLDPKPISDLTHSDKAYRTMLQWLRDGAVDVYDGEKYFSVMDDAAQNVVSTNMTPIETYIDEMKYQFVEGRRPMSEWDDFVAKTLTYGDIQAVLEAYESGILLKYPDELKFYEMPNDY